MAQYLLRPRPTKLPPGAALELLEHVWVESATHPSLAHPAARRRTEAFLAVTVVDLLFLRV